MKPVALFLVPAVFFAGLAGLAANKVNARLDEAAALEMRDTGLQSPTSGTSSAYRSGRLLLPVALTQVEKSRQARVSKETQFRLLKDLQARLGVYRPWAKGGQ